MSFAREVNLSLFFLIIPSAANVSLDQAAYSVGEPDVYVMVCAVLTEGELERDITVYLSTADDTAIGKQKRVCMKVSVVNKLKLMDGSQKFKPYVLLV